MDLSISGLAEHIFGLVVTLRSAFRSRQLPLQWHICLAAGRNLRREFALSENRVPQMSPTIYLMVNQNSHFEVYHGIPSFSDPDLTLRQAQWAIRSCRTSPWAHSSRRSCWSPSSPLAAPSMALGWCSTWGSRFAIHITHIIPYRIPYISGDFPHGPYIIIGHWVGCTKRESWSPRNGNLLANVFLGKLLLHRQYGLQQLVAVVLLSLGLLVVLHFTEKDGWVFFQFFTVYFVVYKCVMTSLHSVFHPFSLDFPCNRWSCLPDTQDLGVLSIFVVNAGVVTFRKKRDVIFDIIIFAWYVKILWTFLQEFRMFPWI